MSETIDAGATMKLTVDLKAGMHTCICNARGHEQLGMKGTLTMKEVPVPWRTTARVTERLHSMRHS